MNTVFFLLILGMTAMFYDRTKKWISLLISQSLNLGGRRGTTDDVETIPSHPSLSSIASHDASLDFCCQGPALTGTKEGR